MAIVKKPSKGRQSASASAVDRKRSLAAKKGAATRALNRELAVKQTLRLHHKIIAVGGVVGALVLMFIGVRSQLQTFAASTTTNSFVGIGGKCLDNQHSVVANHNKIQLYTCNGTNAQKWTVTSAGAIESGNSSSYCLDIPNSNKAQYTYVQLYKCNGTTAQKWTVANHTIVSKLTGFCATVKNGSTSNSTRIWMQTCNSSTSQKWTYGGTTAASGTPVSSTPVTTGSGSGSTTTGSGSGSGTTSTGSGSTTTGSNGVTYGTIAHPFSAKSPWNTPIPSNPTIDPNSSAIVSNVLDNSSLVMNMVLYGYGQPVYTATSSTPKVTFGGQGGSVTFPFDSSWSANGGADAKIDIFDPSTTSEYEFDGFNASSKSDIWWVKHNYVTGLGDGYPTNGERKGPTGSAMSQVAGLIRISDINSGSIDHALSFLTSDPQKGSFRYPASQTDGTRTAANGVQEGMRIQLDPSVDLSTLGLSKGEMMVAKALQTYGAYCSDNGGNNDMAMGFYAEKPTTTADPYPGVGWSSDWAVLSKIPRNKLRVMATSVTPQP